MGLIPIQELQFNLNVVNSERERRTLGKNLVHFLFCYQIQSSDSESIQQITLFLLFFITT